MAVPSWLRKANRKIFRAKTTTNGSLLSRETFFLEVAKERVRADRSRLPLAILVVDLPEDRSTDRDVAYLARVLRRRLRITDVAGDLGNGRVAVLLPDTPKDGAWKVAADICDRYSVGRGRPNCEVYVYPEETHPPADKHRHKEAPVGTASISLDSLFAYPTPMVKRALDVIGAFAGLIVAAPLIFIFGVIIKATSHGPALYSQLREGHGGRRFRIYKLRTMCENAHASQASLRAYSVQDGPAFKMEDDPRTTWIGRLLRKTSLDELPQLWNVLVGDMSLVGPRPLPVEESLQCSSWQRHRLAVVPGLTCVWQVHGRSTVSFEEWMRMDIQYLRDRSLFHDVRLLLNTIPALVFKRGPR